MYLDVVELRDFYATPAGRMVSRHLEPVVASFIRVDAATRVLGFGFATPYLAAAEGAERVLAFMPAGQGVIDWPATGGSQAALVEETAMPLPDSSIDLAILVHALEVSHHPHGLMAELRRVLTGAGRLILIVPSRRGAWARSDVSPFGYGRPYSRGQLVRLFADAGFEAERWEGALHMPPAAWRPLLGAAALFERVGRVLWPAFPGVIVVSAVRRTVQGARLRPAHRLAPALRPALRPNAGAMGRLPP
jgi:SAM-dependent methyltransferase